MTDQPRDEKGRFTDIDTRGIEPIDDREVIGKCSVEHVTPSAEFINVTTDLLEEAIDVAKKHDDVVRLAVLKNEEEREDCTEEQGMVLLKGSPYSEEVVALVGRFREKMEIDTDD